VVQPSTIDPIEWSTPADCSDAYFFLTVGGIKPSELSSIGNLYCLYIHQLPKVTFSLKTMAPLSMAVIVIVVFAFLSSIESFKFFGMPRSISNSLPSSVANQQEIVRTAPTIRDLEPIIVDQSRQLRSISDKDFSENILESEGLSVVLFTR
jgi:hypothetical protein